MTKAVRSIKAMSPPALLPFKGQVTEQIAAAFMVVMQCFFWWLRFRSHCRIQFELDPLI